MYQTMNFYVPHIVFGVGLSKKTGEFAGQFSATKALIICDKGVRRAGVVDGVEESLKTAGISTVIFDDVIPDPTLEVVDAAAAVGKKENVDLVVAVGGGSTIDTAKTARMLITNEGLCKEFVAPLKGFTPFENPGLPLIAIPTTSGTGSEVTCCSVVTDTKINQKLAVGDFQKMPVDFSILDPEVAVGLPSAPTAACGMDVMGHAAEAYLSQIATPFTDAMNIQAFEMAFHALPKAVANGTDLEARADMMIASTMAGIGVGNSNAHLGHGMAHAMGAAWHIPHGVAVGLALPYVFEHVCVHMPEKARKIAEIFGCNLDADATAEDVRDAVVEAMYHLLDQVGIPKASDLGKGMKDLDEIIEYTRHEWALCQISGVPYTEEDCRKYYTEMFMR